MAMELLVTSLQQSLSPVSGIPTDIKFLFKVENDGVSSFKELRAHKLILALVSDVFKKGFYGDFSEDGSIEITDTTHDSFKAMINFIYNVNTDIILYDFDILCSLYNLGEKYNIKALKKETLLAISNKGMTSEEILGVCVLAEQYSVHKELKETLQMATAQSLSTIFKGDLAKAIDFLAQLDIDDSTPISAKSFAQLIARLMKIKPMVCHNCKSSPCLTGGITKENFVPGAKVVSCLQEGIPPNVINLLSVDDRDNRIFFAVDKSGRHCAYILKWYVYHCRS